MDEMHERRVSWEYQKLSQHDQSSLGIWCVFHIQLFPQIRSVNTMCIELWISSVELIPHCPCHNRLAWLWAKHHFSSPSHCGYRSCLGPSQFCRWLLYSSLLSQLQSVRSCQWYFENSICFHVRSNLSKFPAACCHFSGMFRTVLHSWPVLLYYLRFFTRLGTSVQVEECCCSWICLFFFNVTLGAGLGVSLVLNFEMSNDQNNLHVSQRKSWLQMISFARIPILDPALLTKVPSFLHSDHTSISKHKLLSVGTVKSSWGSSSSGSFPKEFVGVRLLDGLCLSPFLLESVLFPAWTKSSVKVLCGICISFNSRIFYIHHHFWFNWNTLVNNKNFHLCLLQYSILVFELPSKMFL